MLFQTTIYALGLSIFYYAVTETFKYNKKVNLALGVNYCDLNDINKKQIVDFIENEVKFALKEGKESFILTYDQLDLAQFDYGVEVELYDILDKANSPLFKKIDIFDNHIHCYLSDVAKATSFFYFKNKILISSFN